MPRKTYSLEKFRELFPSGENNEPDGTNVYTDVRIPEIPSVMEDTGMVDQHIFRTVFLESDISEFQQHLRRTQPMQHRNDLEDRIGMSLQNWSQKHPGQCPYEPFLWALKSTGGYIGSGSNAAIPQPWLLEAVGNALLSVWDDKELFYLDVLKNVILKWDWYQPVHVMIYLYGCLDGINDDEIDECLRNKWLYSALFCDTAFYCLCDKRQTKENIQTLMRFVSQDTQRDLSEMSVQVTNGMRKTFLNYLHRASDDDFEMARTYYQDELYSCSKKARRIFEELFAEDNITDEVAEFISRWRQAGSEKSKNDLRQELHQLFKKENFSKLLISDAASAGIHDLLLEITKLTEEKIRDYTYTAQFLLQNMLECAGCAEYRQFILGNYQKYGKSLKENRGFLFACAYCHLGHPEILGDLFTAFFLNGVGRTRGEFLFLKTQTVFSRQYASEVSRIVKHCLNNDEDAHTLVVNCSKIFRQNNSSLFPVAFSQVCQKLIAAVKQQCEEAVQYAAALMDLYERIVNVQNRDKYHDVLMDIYYGTNSIPLQNAHKRSANLIHTIYRA